MPTAKDASRIHKIFVDSGASLSWDEAGQFVRHLTLNVVCGREVEYSLVHQAALLTIVNCAARCFEGGVFVSGISESAVLRTPWSQGISLAKAVHDLMGRLGEPPTGCSATLILGDVTVAPQEALRVTFDWWQSMVGPTQDVARLGEDDGFSLGSVCAGAMGVAEAFQLATGLATPFAGRCIKRLSLWNPETGEAGPKVQRLPAQLWVIGLGNLGQAALWALSMLPYTDPATVLLYLQDFDVLEPANWSTSMLTTSSSSSQLKTRWVSACCEAVGFQTRIVERRFAGKVSLTQDEPRVSMVCVDNPETRALLDDTGFDATIELGLGSGPQGFLDGAIHTFPGPLKAARLWDSSHPSYSANLLASQPAYQELADEGLDECGRLELAGSSISTPFTGMVAACVAVAEWIRLARREHRFGTIDFSLADLSNLRCYRHGNAPPVAVNMVPVRKV